MSPDDSSFRPARTSQHPFPDWELAYQAALVEVDPKKLLECCKIAEDQIAKRLRDMPDGDECWDERRAIIDAANFLRVLREGALNGMQDDPLIELPAL